MTEPAFFSIPLSSLENMKMELAWRFADLFDQYWSIRENLEDIKLKLLLDDFLEPSISPIFDPFELCSRTLFSRDYYELTD